MTNRAAGSGPVSRELLARLLTAAVAVPLVVCGLLFLPAVAVVLAFGLAMTLGAWEWGRLIAASWAQRVALVAVTLALVVAVAALVTAQSGVGSMVLGAGLAFGAASSLAAAWIIARPATPLSRALGRDGPGFILGLFVLVGAVTAVASVSVGGAGGGRLLAFFVLVWLVDSAGYVAGRLVGGYKLAPAISPGKTWSGAIAGVVSAAVAAGVYAWGVDSVVSIVGFAIAGAVLAAISILGDLTISLLKRRSNLDDTGALFPGHGGILDRLDGLVFAAPWFAIVELWLGVAG